MQKLFFVSHTHWDREWYAPFEVFRFKLVETVDRLLEILDEDPAFVHFHLDGQTIVLDDYLKIRPEKREALIRHIREGRISIGPWYILQDEFLTSGEANIRNMLRGLRDAAAYGPCSSIGYLPDTFGHFSQMPQLLNGFGIDNAIFCRGLTSSYDHFRTPEAPADKSECVWRGPDGSEVLGVFGSNWYNNASELPEDPEQAALRINGAALGAAAFATTDNLLLFNGCDHQPVQKNLPAILRACRPALQDRYELVQTSYADYIDAIRPYRERFPQVEGELTGQNADGKFAFIHTASIRPQIKQLNSRCQSLLECQAEPITVMAMMEGDQNRRAFLKEAWELLMQNHPHDSICCCGDDAVYREMTTRYEKSIEIAGQAAARGAKYIAERVDSHFAGENGRAVTLFNPYPYPLSETVTVQVDFDTSVPVDASALCIVDAEGDRRPCGVRMIGRVFTYTLPEETFRVFRYVNRFEVTFEAEAIPPMGYKTYAVVQDAAAGLPGSPLKAKETEAENDEIRVTFRPDGTFDLLCKATGKTYVGLNAFEDGGDVGDEYTCYAPNEDRIIRSSGGRADVRCAEANAVYAEYEVTMTMDIPDGFGLLDGEDFETLRYDGAADHSARKRQSRRSGTTVPMAVTTRVRVPAHGRRISIRTTVDNPAGNHRLRAVFPTALSAEGCFAHTPFDVVERPFGYRPHWGLTDLCDRQQAFAGFRDEENVFVVANRGSYEYEACPEDCTFKLTLFRCIDEMGDWGDFPTPEAQLIGESSYEYALLVGEAADYGELVRQAVAYNGGEPAYAEQPAHDGNLPAEKSYLSFSAPEHVLFSALKPAEDSGRIVLRLYNYSNEEETLSVSTALRDGQLTDLNETPVGSAPCGEGGLRLAVPAKKIVTLSFAGPEGPLEKEGK